MIGGGLIKQFYLVCDRSPSLGHRFNLVEGGIEPYELRYRLGRVHHPAS
jgi:hypothetical protein